MRLYILFFMFFVAIPSFSFDDGTDTLSPALFARRLLRIRLQAERTALRRGSLPVITVRLRYTGRSSLRIRWDRDFGRMLWDGGITLVAKRGNDRKSSAGLKIRTSNTYPPREIRTLRRGTVLTSRLDLNRYPGILLRHLFRKSGPVRLYLQLNRRNQLVGNPLLLHIR